MNMLKKLYIVIGFILGVTIIGLNAGEKPNVIIIYTDDQGTLDLNSYGAEDLATPNMDEIARSGVRFTQFYANAVCSPSRAMLLTGKTAQRAGVPHNVSRDRGLPPEQYTMAEMFRDAGYATALVGKWHLGEIDGKLPNDQGFEYFFGHTKGCIDNYSHFFYWKGPNVHNLYENKKQLHLPGEFFPELMLDRATNFIEQHKESPFFLYYALNTPHYPYQGEEKWLDYYDEKQVEYPRNLYAAFISTMDEYLGELMDVLDQHGLKENTIIILQSDNGHSTEDRAHHGGGYTGVYRGAKASLFEGGIRIPAAIAWPGKLPANEVRDQMCLNVDWMPTLAELCGIELNASDLNGKSLMPIIEDEGAKTLHPEGFYWDKAISWMVRKGHWKLHGNPRATGIKGRPYMDEKIFLVNLKQDPGEQVNLVEKYPEKVKELKAEYQKWKATEKE
jgi:arylsulfatase A-like enzyme